MCRVPLSQASAKTSLIQLQRVIMNDTCYFAAELTSFSQAAVPAYDVTLSPSTLRGAGAIQVLMLSTQTSPWDDGVLQIGSGCSQVNNSSSEI